MGEWYNASGAPGNNSPGSSAEIRGEFKQLQTKLNNLPQMSGNSDAFVKVNSGATSLESVAGVYSNGIGQIAVLAPGNDKIIVGDGSEWISKDIAQAVVDAQAFKTKKLTGDTPSSSGSSINIAHGLDATKIISATTTVHKSVSSHVIENSVSRADHEFFTRIEITNLEVVTTSTNSSQVLNKPFTTLITYEE